MTIPDFAINIIIAIFDANIPKTMDKKRYQPINFPIELVEELKIWRQAFMIANGRTVSYGEMIRYMLDSMDIIKPEVTKAMSMLIEQHPELASKVGKFKSNESEEATL